MHSDKRHRARSDELREKAESLLKTLPSSEPDLAQADILKVLHELHVHQIELELQNDELQNTQKALEQSRQDYMRLYHDAPVGYVVLDKSGITRKVNKTFAIMLNSDVNAMCGTPFADFLIEDDRAIFRARLKAFYKNPLEKTIDVRLARNESPLYVSLQAIINSEEHPFIPESNNELLVTVSDVSERHEYQVALEKSMQNLEEILSSISDGFMSLDSDLIVQYFNSAAEQILKIDRSEVLHRQLFEAFPVAKGSYFETQYHKALASQEVTHFETYFDKPPLSDWYEVSVYPFSEGLSVFFRVITERKLAEEAIRESEERFRSYIEHSPYGVFVTNKEGSFQQVNPALCEITGLSAEKMLMKKVSDIFMLGFPAKQKKNSAAEMKPSPSQREIRYLGRNKAIGWASLSTVKIGKDKYLNYVEEISERKHIETNLLESRRALALYNKIATIFLTSGKQALFHDVLDLLLQTFNCSHGFVGYISAKNELVCPTITRHIWDKCDIEGKDFVFPRKKWGGLWGRSLIEKKSLMANQNLTVPEGHIDLHNALAVPILHHDVVIGQFLLANKEDGFSESDLKLLENTAKQTAPILRSLLNTFEQEKLKSRLSKVNQQLKKVESLNRMAAAVAHNYNNLLTIIMGGIELAREAIPDKYQDIHRHLTNALSATENGAKIGAMLLTYLGQTIQEQAPVDLGELVKECLDNSHLHSRNDVSFQFSNPESSAIVAADPELLEQLLSSLLANAIEAMEGRKGNILINITSVAAEKIPRLRRFPVEWQPLEDQYVSLEISDRGCGIAPENIEKLFDPFYSEKFTGRGMGLAIALGIVKIYNGVITVNTTVDKGSTFRVFFPLERN